MPSLSQVRVELPLYEIEQEIRQQFDQELEPIAKAVAATAQRSAAFADKTGRLRKSIRAAKSKFQDGGWIVMATAPHAHLIEFGHAHVRKGKVVGHVPPHPFLRPALTEVVNKWLHTARAMSGGAYDERG